MIVTEKYARANWWCPERKHRIPATGHTGFNMSIFPVKMQWKNAFIAWLFPNYFWFTIGRHGRCLGSGCSVWRWSEFKKTGWCGLAPPPENPVTTGGAGQVRKLGRPAGLRRLAPRP
jgi:hypothetical protein